MESFAEFVTDVRIIDCICRKRVSEAQKRHKLHHQKSLSKGVKYIQPSNEIYNLTPPRREWKHLGANGRYIELSNGKKQLITTYDRNLKSLLWTINEDRRTNKETPYLVALNNFISTVKQKAVDKDYSISSPRVIPIFKKKRKDGKSECRPICLFENLCDSVIISLANKYLSKIFDKYFYEDSLAFRPKRMFHGKIVTTCHHDAVTLISEYLSKHKKRRIYVAECDMQKFYDTVDHEIVSREFLNLLSTVRTDNPSISFDDITRVFLSYLNCYDFPKDVLTKNGDNNYWRTHRIPNGTFGWIAHLNKDEGVVGSNMYRLGVPQGGALSGLIANIVINKVDKTVLPNLHSKNDLYVRYCDDMLLLSTNNKRCEKLFKLYSQSIEEAHLKPHLPEEITFGTKEYWKTKTKSVYQWSMHNRQAGSRWIGFVGYEINRSGEIRIRKSSIKKEKRKQKKVVSEIFKLTYKKLRVNDGSIESSYRGTLMSMAVGRATLWNYEYLKNEFCWINGFKMLNDNPIVKTQIRDLDRCRNHVIKRSNKRLSRLGTNVSGEILQAGASKAPSYISYYGKPFSYYYHYLKNLTHK